MAKRKTAPKKRPASDQNVTPETPRLQGRLLTARPDTVDFRDKMYVPTLVEVPSRRPVEDYMAAENPVLDQGSEGACTGFGLAAVANYLLRTRRVVPDTTPVSARMLYEMARRNDEWEGEAYSGSSARGAMKGWHKYGVCSEPVWPYRGKKVDGHLTTKRIEDARLRPLGAYFRVNHKDIVAMHSAISEVGILYATAFVHEGWSSVTSKGIIRSSDEILGGHAFAIVGYDEKGFWIQNSWGEDWGKGGFAHLGYADWMKNGSDVWVARLGVPVLVDSAAAAASDQFASSQTSQSASFADLRPHIVSLGNDGVPAETGGYGNSPREIEQIIHEDLPRLTKGWRKKRILLYAHGGLVGEKLAVQRVAEYRRALLAAEVYPLAFVWHSDFWSTLKNILREALGLRKSEGPIDEFKDFMLDRLDGTLEPLARTLGGKSQWDEMKENALAATLKGAGGARLVAEGLKVLAHEHEMEIHCAAHSAGAIFMAPLVEMLSRSVAIQSCTLWAPACTLSLFKKYYLPLLGGRDPGIREFALYTLTDEAERDDHCAHIYNKSLLYLVSQAFEEDFQALNPRWPGVALLGMERFVKDDPDLTRLFGGTSASWILAPNTAADPLAASRSTSHGGFDDDAATVQGTLARILGGGGKEAAGPAFARSAASIGDRRRILNRLAG